MLLCLAILSSASLALAEALVFSSGVFLALGFQLSFLASLVAQAIFLLQFFLAFLVLQS